MGWTAAPESEPWATLAVATSSSEEALAVLRLTMKATLHDSDGAHIPTFGSEGSDKEHFDYHSCGIATIDSIGRIVMAGTGNYRVQVLE